MKNTMLAIAVLGLVTLMPAVPAPAADDSAIEMLLPQLAATPEGNKAVASYYRQKAADAKAEAQRHREMAKNYAESNFTRRQIMKEHCDKLVAEYEGLAKQYEDMAAEFGQAAAKK